MGSVTYVKFMTREELINMLTEIHRFNMITRDGRKLTMDNRVSNSRPVYEDYKTGTICYRATAFKLNAFDYLDCLTSGEGYVRYSSFKYGKKDSAQGKILIERYGFKEED